MVPSALGLGAPYAQPTPRVWAGPSAHGIATLRTSLSLSVDECGFYGAPHGPAGVVYDPTTSEVFVADSETNEIYVISDTNDMVVASIWLGAACVNPFGLAYDPDSREVLVAETGAGVIAAISDLNDSVAATIPVHENIWSLAYDSALDELFAAAPDQGNISVVSLSTQHEVATISENRTEEPVAVAYDPALGEVFVANDLGWMDTLLVISDGTNRIVATVPISCAGRPPSTFQNPMSVAYDSRAASVYVSCLLDGTLSVVSTGNNTQEAIAGSSSYGSGGALAYDAASGRVWVTDPFDNQVEAISDLNNSVVAHGPVSSYPMAGIAVDDRTGQVFVSGFNSDNVTVLSSNGAFVANVSLPPPPTIGGGGGIGGPASPFDWIDPLLVVAAIAAVVLVDWEIRRRRRRRAPVFGWESASALPPAGPSPPTGPPSPPP